ncbi:MAG: aminodeoxychorismate synthase component I [Verrucomicrobiota bacterium]
MSRAVFCSQDENGKGWDACLENALAIHVARRMGDVVPVLRLAEAEAARGRWVAVAVAYEAAPAFDPALRVHPAELPLVWVAVFGEASPSRRDGGGSWQVSEWRPQVPRGAYTQAIHRIKDYIAAGDTYQVNYTFPLSADFEGDPAGWFSALCRAQRAGFCADLDMGRYRVLSLSPELLFEQADGQITLRPMKGTMSRGRWCDEDLRLADTLAASAKNRAENVMIVDLLRSDLGRIAAYGTVRVPRLFDVERYPTVFQMTSTIEARARPGTGLVDLLAALFPSGSVTGAPKIRAVEIIRELEPFPRGIYTGAIGLLRPGGSAVFNVAIRTIVLDSDTRRATLSVGGGVTWDSTAEDEYEECLLKASFAGETQPAFDLLETLRLEDGSCRLLERHLRRIRASAGYFGFRWDERRTGRALEECRAGHPRGLWRVRLTLSREGVPSVSAEPLPADLPSGGRVALASEPVNSGDRFLFHKTTNRATYDRLRAARPDGFDVILWNERGEVTESCIANVVAVLDGKKYTPPVSSGLLQGVFREELLERGEILERVIRKEDLRRAERLFLVNSLRGWMPLHLTD